MRKLTIYITLLTTVLFTQLSCIRSEVENSLTSEEQLKLLMLTGAGDQNITRISKADGKNIVISGSFQNSMKWKGQTISSSGIKNTFIIKLDENYDIIWYKVFPHGISGVGTLNSLTTDPNNGNVFAGIHFTEEVSTPTTTYNATDSDSDLLLVYLSSESGEVLWEDIITGSGSEMSTDADIDSNGNIYVSITYKETISFFSRDDVSLGSEDILIIKINSHGVYQWHVTGKSVLSNRAWGVRASKSHIYVSSFFVNDINFNGQTYSSPSGGDGLIIKMDIENGATTWAIPLNQDSDKALPYGICEDHHNNIYITGYYTGQFTLGDFNITSAGSNDGFLLKLNQNGKVNWLKSIGGTGSDLGLSLSCDKDNGIGLGGFHASTNFSLNGKNIFATNGSNDSYLLNLTFDGNLKWGKSLGLSGSETTWGENIPLPTGKYVTGGIINGTGSALGEDVITSASDGYIIEIKK